MSISIVLVPIAIVAIAAWQASRKDMAADGQIVCHVTTRMRDDTLLIAALTDTDARVTRQSEMIEAVWHDTQAQFTRDSDGIWQVHFIGSADEQRAIAMVMAVDQFYGRRVQQVVLARLKERAPAAGMSIASETVEDDDSVTLVLNVLQGA